MLLVESLIVELCGNFIICLLMCIILSFFIFFLFQITLNVVFIHVIINLLIVSEYLLHYSLVDIFSQCNVFITGIKVNIIFL